MERRRLYNDPRAHHASPPAKKPRLAEEPHAAPQVLERENDVEIKDLGEDAEDLPGWQKHDVLTTISTRFGFREPVTASTSSLRMDDKACAWTVGDAAWVVPKTSALPILFGHMLKDDLKGVAANLCDLSSAVELDWNVDVTILTEGEKTFYEIRPRSAEASSPSILLESAATALQIVRAGWGHDSDDVESIIRNLVKWGAEFYPSWHRPARHVPLTPQSQPTPMLGFRPAGYKPTLVDFRLYIQHRDEFLRSSRGRAALFYGGVVGRIARLVLSDFEDIACLGPSEDILKTGRRVLSRDGKGALWHQALTWNEINLICGVYTVETGQTSRVEADGHQLKSMSWWPTPTAFWSSGFNTGWWNANSERWFVKRLKEIQGAQAKLYTWSEWKNKLRFSSAARKVNAKNDDLAAQYLAARFR